MSKNPIITEGVQGRAFNEVAKLGIPLVAGGESFWVPKDERQLESLSVKANGTYRPKEKYGISRVSVSVPGTTGKISGKGSDGNDYTVDVDSSDNLVKTKVPSSIQITTEPTDTSYTNGDTIDFTGMVVKAYDGNGNLFTDGGYTGGVIPNSELQFPVTVAVNDGSGGGGSAEHTSYITPRSQEIDALYPAEASRINFPIISSNYCEWESRYWHQIFTINNGYIFVTGLTASGVTIHLVSLTPTTYTKDMGLGVETYQLNESDLVTYNGETFYHHTDTSYNQQGLVCSLPDVGGSDGVYIGYYILFGDTSGGGNVSQTIPVNWPRYNDGKILSDSFDITVSPSPSNSGNNSGGNTGGNGGTTVDDDGFSGHDGNF